VALVERDARVERLERKGVVHLACHEFFERRQYLPEDTPPMAPERLSRLQRQILAWLWAEEQRTYGSMPASHETLVRAFAHEKGNLSHSLKNLEAKGFIQIARTPGGRAAALDLTAAGRSRLGPPSDVVMKEHQTPSQIEVVNTLLDQWHGMKQYGRKTPDDIKHMGAEARLREDLKACDQLVFEAYRLGLRDHPLIQDWITTLQRQGQIKVLRGAHVGLEKGVKRPYTEEKLREEAAIIEALHEHQLHGGQKTLAAIHRELKQEGKITGSRQALYNRCIRDGLFALSADDGHATRLLATRLLGFLRDRGSLDRTVISGLLSRHTTRQQLTRALRWLEREQFIVIERQRRGAGGRPRTVVHCTSPLITTAPAKKLPSR
jgi:DNA-binding MarR family transcriptional regulator